MAFVSVFSTTDIPLNAGRCANVNGLKVAVFNLGARYLAVEDTCTHDEASLAEGEVVDHDGECRVECPWHGAQFNLVTGAAMTMPAVRPVKTYPVRVSGDRIEIDIPG